MSADVSPRRTYIPLATLAFAALVALAVTPGSALAERPFGTTVPQYFPGLENITINQTNNDVWITDEGEETKEQSGENGLYKYGPYPSQTLLEMPNTSGAVFGIERIQVAVDESNGELVVGDSNPRKVDFYEGTGPRRAQLHAHLDRDQLSDLVLQLHPRHPHRGGQLAALLARSHLPLALLTGGRRRSL